MNAERPLLDEADVNVFLKGASATNTKKPSTKCTEEDSRSKGGKTACTKESAKRVVTKDREQVVKFMVELPAELRRKIKFESVSADVPMNSLIVSALKNYFS